MAQPRPSRNQSRTPAPYAFLILAIALLSVSRGHATEAQPTTRSQQMEKIKIARDGKHFVSAESGKPFVPWGFNYLGTFGSLVEESWATDWPRLEKDFAEMRNLGANVVRVHLQFSSYMKGKNTVDPAEIERLRKMLDLARDQGLYLDITGLSCYRLARVPAWYDALEEADRWQAQANFWEAIAKACASHPAVFCYDLMNEPIITGPGKPAEPRWLTGELGGFHFVQRISLDSAEKRSRIEIAEAWVSKLIAAIRNQDPRTPITLGVIPWAAIWPAAKPIFYSPEVGKHLDFVSIHLYPKKGEVAKAINALAVYDIGKPLVIEETFPMNCSMDEFKDFLAQSRGHAGGWMAHYFGHTLEEHRQGAEPGGAIVGEVLKYWREKGKTIAGTLPRE